MRSIGRLSAVAVVLLALAGSACDRPTGPAYAEVAAPRAGVFDGGYRLVTRRSFQSSVTVMAVLGSGGGTLSVNGNTLQVPAGALAQATTFTMSTVSGMTVGVSLSAKETRTGAAVTAFDTPLRLSLSYANAKVTNPNNLKIAWLVNGQIVAVQASAVDKAHKLVSSSLYHFSDWGVSE